MYPHPEQCVEENCGMPVLKKLTPAERVMRALRGGQPDRTPFTIYDIMLPRCTAERKLRNRGLCLIRLARSYRVVYPNTGIKSERFEDKNGRIMVRTEYSTPHGDLYALAEDSGYANNWPLEYLFKSPDDYKKLLFLINDARILPEYSKAAALIGQLGEDYLVRDQIGLEPMQALISSDYMGTMNFCIEWKDNRDDVLKLYEALVEMNRKVYSVVADGPLAFSNYGGNVVPQIIGAELFRQYYMPHYKEATESLHKKGKLIGCHFDADNTAIMDDIARTPLDYIEAYDAGMSPPVGEAMRKWPDKVLWINWPSAWHLEDEDTVCRKTAGLIREAGAPDRFIIGITEDVPDNRLQGNLMAIMGGIDKFHGIK